MPPGTEEEQSITENPDLGIVTPASSSCSLSSVKNSVIVICTPPAPVFSTSSSVLAPQTCQPHDVSLITLAETCDIRNSSIVYPVRPLHRAASVPHVASRRVETAEDLNGMFDLVLRLSDNFNVAKDRVTSSASRVSSKLLNSIDNLVSYMANYKKGRRVKGFVLAPHDPTTHCGLSSLHEMSPICLVELDIWIHVPDNIAECPISTPLDPNPAQPVHEAPVNVPISAHVNISQNVPSPALDAQPVYFSFKKLRDSIDGSPWTILVVRSLLQILVVVVVKHGILSAKVCLLHCAQFG